MTARIDLEDQRVGPTAQFTVLLFGTARTTGRNRSPLLLSPFYPSVHLYAAGTLSCRIEVNIVTRIYVAREQ